MRAKTILRALGNAMAVPVVGAALYTVLRAAYLQTGMQGANSSAGSIASSGDGSISDTGSAASRGGGSSGDSNSSDAGSAADSGDMDSLHGLNDPGMIDNDFTQRMYAMAGTN